MHFDVILPTIVRESLFAAINSVCEQTHEDWSLYIVVDGTVVPSMLSQAFPNPNIYWLKVKEPSQDFGAAARNFGIFQGSAKWTAYIDDDDEWLPHHLETLAAMAAANPEASMLRTAGQSFKMAHRHPRSSKRVRKMGPINTQDPLTVGMAHTRELFNQTEGWLPCDNHDHILWKQMIDAGGKVIKSDEVTFIFKR
jgi:glycosyltransferase involved in cell wall biosynthesis